MKAFWQESRFRQPKSDETSKYCKECIEIGRLQFKSTLHTILPCPYNCNMLKFNCQKYQYFHNCLPNSHFSICWFFPTLKWNLITWIFAIKAKITIIPFINPLFLSLLCTKRRKMLKMEMKMLKMAVVGAKTTRLDVARAGMLVRVFRKVFWCLWGVPPTKTGQK